MGKKSAPAAPDYTATATQQANQQQELNTQNTWANRVNQSNPWGTSTYSATQGVDPVTGKPVTQWSQNTSLNPNSQRALDATQATQAGMAEAAQGMSAGVFSQLGQPIDKSGMTNWGQGPQAGNLQAVTNPYGFSLDTPGDTRARAEDAIYKSATSRLDPQWQQRQSDMDTQLANQGITRGSEAYNRAADDFGRSRNDAYNQAQMAAITGGGAEAQRDFQQQLSSGQFGLQGENQAFAQQQAAGNQNFNQGMSSAQYSDTQRQQQLEELLSGRGQGLNELMTMMGGSTTQMPTFGNYTQATGSSAPDLMGAAEAQYKAAADAKNAKAASTSGMISSAATIAAAFI